MYTDGRPNFKYFRQRSHCFRNQFGPWLFARNRTSFPRIAPGFAAMSSTPCIPIPRIPGKKKRRGDKKNQEPFCLFTDGARSPFHDAADGGGGLLLLA
eukprot:1610798-Rhodomonas_salina.1